MVDGRTKLRTNVVEKTAEGEARLTAKVLWQDKNLADVRLAALVRGQTVDVHELQAQVLGGTVDGTAVVPLNRWNDSVAQLHWREVQLQQLETWLPSVARLQGTMSGSLAGRADTPARGRRTEDRGQTTADRAVLPPDAQRRCGRRPSSVVRNPSFGTDALRAGRQHRGRPVQSGPDRSPTRSPDAPKSGGPLAPQGLRPGGALRPRCGLCE